LQKYIVQKLIEDFKNLLLINLYRILLTLRIYSSAGSFLKIKRIINCSPQGLAGHDSFYFNSISIQLGA